MRTDSKIQNGSVKIMNYQDYQLKKIFNFKLIGIGFIFLIDYNIGAVDILPDWIGLVLILLGIGKTAYINSNFGSAAKYIKIWLAVAVIKSILTAIEIAYSVFNDSDMLLFAVLFGLFDLFFSFIVFGNIIAACDMFLNIDNQFDNLRKLTYIYPILKIFFAVKFILTVLSQLPLLLSEMTYDYLSVKYNIFFTLEIAKNIITPPCFIASTLFGLFAASLVAPFFNSVSKSETLCEIIKDEVNHLFLNDRFFMLKRSFDHAFGFFMVGIAFFVDFEFDRINLLPDFVIYICLLFGLKILSVFERRLNYIGKDKSRKSLKVFIFFGLLISLAAYIFTTVYRSEYLELAVALDTIFIFRILASVFYILSVALFFIIAVRFFENIKKIREYHYGFSQIYLKTYVKKDEVKNKNKLLLILLGITSAAKISSLFIGDIDSLEIGVYKFFIAVILIAFVVFAVRYLYKVKHDIYDFYK